MTDRKTASAIFLMFAVVSTGCQDAGSEYVDFKQTAPTSLDAKTTDAAKAQQVSNDSKQPAGGATESSSGGTSQAARPEVSTPVDASVEREGAGANSGGSKPVTENTTSSVSPPMVENKSDTPTAATVAATATSPESVTAAQTVSSTSTDAASVDAPRTLVSEHSGLSGQADTPVVENAPIGEPRKIELLIPEKHLRKERGTSAVRVSFDDIDLLKVLNMEPVPVNAVDYFPDWLKALDGKPIRIRGYMYPTYEATGLKSFSLVRDTGICCFVRQPKIYDIIDVDMADGVTADYMELKPFDVEGTLRIEPQADEKDLARLYRIDNARILR